MDDDERILTTFDKAPEFFKAFSAFLNVDLQHEPTPSEIQTENALWTKLVVILHEYDEQAYLLDPFLEQMMTPAVEILKEHAARFAAARLSGQTATWSSKRLGRFSLLVYHIIRCRGRKTIVNFFPHQVADLSIALEYLTAPDSPAQHPSNWPLRYIVLLWLSLICMIPFNLSKFDDIDLGENERSSTAQKIQSCAIHHLARPGLEREASVILLSKLYTRTDTSSLLGDFIKQGMAWLKNSPDNFQAIGVLPVLCELTKSGLTAFIKPHLADVGEVLSSVESNPHLLSNRVTRRLRLKLKGRLAVGSLPSRATEVLRRARVLQPDAEQEVGIKGNEINFDDIGIPEEVEQSISVLLEGVQDADTTVRYSASKHLARVAARLPPSLSDQVLENVIQLFSIHASSDIKLEDIPTVAEATWHGACLAGAEMARRGLIGTDHLPDLLDWLKKALLFDIRAGSHSVGSSVRDSASYVLWALARSQDASGLKLHALSLAQRLVVVSLYDREIHIRRAASAAFQENVGRLNIFPHGIDILRKIDFFAIGIRKNAFLVAAPQVAAHEEYRSALVDHLITKTLIHWDASMRLLGAQSLKAICDLDLATLGPKVEARVVTLLDSLDVNHIHGGLLGLSELAASYKARGDLEAERFKIFGYLSRLHPTLIQDHRNEQIHEAACHVLANTMSIPAMQLDPSPTSWWRSVIEAGLRHRDATVQDAAAKAIHTLSTLVDCSSNVQRFIKDFAKGSPALQQSLAHALGSLAYDKFDHAVQSALQCLLGGVNASSREFSSNVEARRNCFLAIPELLCTLRSRVLHVADPTVMDQVFQAYIRGLDDYTMDERGDVGSWIRLASIRGICMTIELLFDIAPTLGPSHSFRDWLPVETFHNALGGVLKQGVERLDNVRHQAGEYFLKLLRKGPPDITGGEHWQVCGYPLMKQLFLGEEETGWNEGTWLFPKAVRTLEIERYRKPVLYGLILSVGSKTDSIQRPVASSLTTYIGSLPLVADNSADLDLLKLASEILDLALNDLAFNRVVVPVLQTLDLLLDAGILSKLDEIEAGTRVLHAVLDISTRNVARLKNLQRVTISMKIVNGMLTIPHMTQKASSFLRRFLLHEFAKVRAETAEHLYLVMQAKDFGFDTTEAEDILLETDWSTAVGDLGHKVDSLLALFQAVH